MSSRSWRLGNRFWELSTLSKVTKSRFEPRLCPINLYAIYIYIYIFFFFFLATPATYGGSQARGPIRAIATGLNHSQSSAESKMHLWPTPQFMATPDPEQVRFVNHWVTTGTPLSYNCMRSLFVFVFVLLFFGHAVEYGRWSSQAKDWIWAVAATYAAAVATPDP